MTLRGNAASVGACTLALAIACGGDPAGKQPPASDGLTDDAGVADVEDALFEAEVLARRLFETTPIALSGQVIDLQGRPVAGAQIRAGSAAVSSDPEGYFLIEQLPRRNTELQIDAPGYKSALTHVHLAKPVSEANVALGSVPLTPDAPETQRFLFGGDTAFGRRFVDPEERAGPLQLPDSVPGAWIDARNPGPGAQGAMQYVRTLFLNADYPVVNLETPVTDTPSEYHPTKEFIFYTLPETLDVFPWLGVRYVSLGNNHVFDYLQDGVRDTLASLDEYGVFASGAGFGPMDAFLAHREKLGGTSYSLLSMTSVSGSQNPPLYVATSDPEKGGAADLRDDERVAQALERERGLAHVPIAQLHTGQEYTFKASAFARQRMEFVVDHGAALVIAHHPHVAQGFRFHDGVLIAESLGNLCFDQARLETMLGLLAVVDMNGEAVVSAAGVPVYLEDYRPRPATGELAEHLLRRIAEVSEDASVVLHHASASVLPTSTPIDVKERTVEVQLDLSAGEPTIIDLRPLRQAGESLAQVTSAEQGWTLQAGQDLLVYGDFEDWDVDEDQLEVSRWDVSGTSSFPCVSQAHRGAVALCSVRSSKNRSNSVTAFRNRIRVLGEALGTPNKDLTLVGYAQGDNAGEVWIEAQSYASVGPREFERLEAWRHPAGDYGWHFFSAALNLPADKPGTDPLTANPHALRLFVFQAPPADGDAVARLDDLAVVSWREERSLDEVVSLPAPNPVDFLRVSGPTRESMLTLTWQKAELTAP